jgi:GGDEF domain-containing protein
LTRRIDLNDSTLSIPPGSIDRFTLVQRTRIRVAAQDLDLGVTISIGGTVAIHGDTAAAIFAQADAALHAAKGSGRNAVRLSGDVADGPQSGAVATDP